MTTYATFASHQTNIKHGQDAGKSLVLGWQITADHDGTRMEKLFALHVDGRMTATDWMQPSHDFDRKGRAWTLVDAIPPEAEFIGNYPDTMF